MSVDPNIDYHSHDPEDSEELSEDPAIRRAQETERKIRGALATKDKPLRDDETTAERLRRSGEEARAEDSAQDSGDSVGAED